MSFQPVVPLGGYAGWRFLERTLEAQQTAFAESRPVARATEYFRDNIGKVQTAADLVADRQLLGVALGAFGLEDDINNQFFIRKILEDGTLADDALANRLADKRYLEFSRAFGFGDGAVSRTTLTRFVNDVVDRYETAQFARAVGEQNNDLRLALNVNKGISDVLEQVGTDRGRWFAVMGNPPLRNVFQTALGLPPSIASIDLDQQQQIFEERATAVLGSGKVADFTDPAQQEKLIRLYMVRAEAAQFVGATGASTALTLLQSAQVAR